MKTPLAQQIAATSAATVAQNIRQIRLAQNIPQREIARRTGMALRSYQNFERAGEIRLMKFLEVLRALGRLSEFANAVPVFRPQTVEEARRIDARRQRSASPRKPPLPPSLSPPSSK